MRSLALVPIVLVLAAPACAPSNPAGLPAVGAARAATGVAATSPAGLGDGGEERSAPTRARLVKMLSWAEPVPEGSVCEPELEGTEPPARFRLAYQDGLGAPGLVENDVEALFAAGWSIVDRSPRGYGFERAGDFRSFDFDIVEELQCSCAASLGGPAAEAKHLVSVNVDWASGGAPEVRARLALGGGEAVEVIPVQQMNGRLAVVQFRFEHPTPRPLGAGETGACASGFFAAILLDQPVE